MFKLVGSNKIKYGVLDTDDNIVEYYSASELCNIINDYNVVIEGCFCSNEQENDIVVYSNDKVLFYGKNYRLILDSEKELINVVCGSMEYANFKISISDKLVYKVRDGLFNRIIRSKMEVDRNLLITACRDAKEIRDSLFINFKCGCILEFYKDGNSVKANLLENLEIS